LYDCCDQEQFGVLTDAAFGRSRLRDGGQRGVVTSPATAVVLLPGRDRGPVVVPVAPAGTLDGVLRYEMSRIEVLG
jgi:hypothetical protein